MPLAPNSYICGIHFPAGHPNKDHYSSSIFLGKPVVSKCYSRVSTKGVLHVTDTSMLKPQLTVNLSIKEDSSVAYSVVLTHPIDAHVEAARGEKIEELESTIKDEGYRRIGESAVRISCRGGKAQVFCCQTSSCLCKFPLVQRFVCRLLMMFFIWWKMQLPLWHTVELLVMIYPDAHQKHVTQPWSWTSVDFDETSGQLSWTIFGSTFFSQPVTVSDFFDADTLPVPYFERNQNLAISSTRHPILAQGVQRNVFIYTSYHWFNRAAIGETIKPDGSGCHMVKLQEPEHS